MKAKNKSMLIGAAVAAVALVFSPSLMNKLTSWLKPSMVDDSKAIG